MAIKILHHCLTRLQEGGRVPTQYQISNDLGLLTIHHKIIMSPQPVLQLPKLDTHELVKQTTQKICQSDLCTVRISNRIFIQGLKRSNSSKLYKELTAKWNSPAQYHLLNSLYLALAYLTAMLLLTWKSAPSLKSRHKRHRKLLRKRSLTKHKT